MTFFEPHTPVSRVLRACAHEDDIGTVDCWEDVPIGWRLRVAHFLQIHDAAEGKLRVRACYLTYRDDTISFDRAATTTHAPVVSGPEPLVVYPRKRLYREELIVDDFVVSPTESSVAINIDCDGAVDERAVNHRFHLSADLTRDACPCCG